MKNMKNITFGALLAATLICAMLLTACDNIPETPEIQTTIENGYGRISINFAEGEDTLQQARTVLPQITFDKSHW